MKLSNIKLADWQFLRCYVWK